MERSKQNKRFDEWREECRKKLPEIAAEVFSLRNTLYMGCGYHYELEMQLGYCISQLNDFTYKDYYYGDDYLSNQIFLQRRFEMLCKTLAEARASAENLAISSNEKKGID